MSETIAKTLLFNTLSSLLSENQDYKKLCDLLKEGRTEIRLAGSSFLHVLLATIYREQEGRMMLVFPTDQDAEHCANDLSNWDIPYNILPWWQSYHPLRTGDAVFGKRSLCLHQIARNPRSLILLSLRSFLSSVPPPKYLRSFQIPIAIHDEVDPISIAEQLILFGYRRVPKVQLHGEFALRGEVLDVFLSGDELPIRVTFEYNVVEQIKNIDPLSQLSQTHYQEIVLYPACEVVWNKETFAQLRNSYHQFKDFARSIVYEEIERGNHVHGEEILYPFVFPRVYPPNYLDTKAGDHLVFIDPSALKTSEEAFQKEYNTASEAQKLPDYHLSHAAMSDYQASLDVHSNLSNDASSISFDARPGQNFFGNIELFQTEAKQAHIRKDKVLICAGNELQAKRVASVIHDEKVTVLPENIHSGFYSTSLKLLVVAERELFGRKQSQSLRETKSESITSYVDLAIDDYVVHVMHGIGCFKGIARMRVSGNERDYMHLEYADKEFLYVPIEQVNQVQKYIAYGDAVPRLDYIGGKSWQLRKNRVRKQVEELAGQLIQLYARRQIVRGFAFAADSEWQLQFEASFPYTETKDQLQCLAEVKADMESKQPMERLICGDVGFGKTEIALRAAFKAVNNGKQVAFLAPTTILAEQHYELILDRMKNFPVQPAMLSRFVPRAKQKQIITALREGSIDLVVGTHRLLGIDVAFKDLGLIILDEEQRFGVKAKETLKEMKTNVDSLVLTATPIPRTLHMSLLKIRNVSFIRTPPYNRKSVHTVVGEFQIDVITSAIRHEIERGGQVYYLHNRVQSLEKVQRFIESIVPEAIVEMVHGQMSSQDLENRIHRFLQHGSNVLVTTTIIENGIDIANVNTIIIDRADMYGVAQLYQLRGRVGRSDRQSFAYLFYPNEETLSDIARKRLETIADNTELGAGFQIALRDMEVRGAGNILGHQQSGNITAIGFDLYLQLLQEAVDIREGREKLPAEQELHLELEYSGYIPDDYISDLSQKMAMYKRIASINTSDELELLRGEISDRFGTLPEEVHSMLALADIRILCKSLSIISMRERKSLIRIEFGNVAVISTEKIISLIRNYAGTVRIDPKQPNVLLVKTGKNMLQEKSQYISTILKRIL